MEYHKAWPLFNRSSAAYLQPSIMGFPRMITEGENQLSRQAVPGFQNAEIRIYALGRSLGLYKTKVLADTAQQSIYCTLSGRFQQDPLTPYKIKELHLIPSVK